MTEAYWNAFFELHRDLPREGPGLPSDVAWAAEVAGLRADARICDAACGPGADIAALKAAAPLGQITAIDKMPAFVDQARATYANDPAVTLCVGDMAEIKGPYDFIWSAGAVYFLGVKEALSLWRHALAPGGAVAFSQACWFTQTPSAAARAGWADYPQMTDEAGVLQQIADAGYDCVASKRLSDAAWEAYYTPLDARISVLSDSDTAGTALADVLAEARAEADLWRAERDSFGYLLCVARPV